MISLHIVADNSDPMRIARAIDYLANTHQTAVNVAGGSQIDIAMDIVERIHRRMPNIQVFWRHLEDTGNIFDMSANDWWAQRVFPRLKWLQEHKAVFVIDNESSGDDAKIMQYADQSIIRMHMLHSAGLYGAFCRFATGNIQEHQYIYLKPLLEALDAHDWISPNEYTNLPGKSSGGHLERYKRILGVLPDKHFNVAIGECGILDDYQANAGYVGRISGKDMAAQLIADEMWYNGGTIPRFLFCIGGYGEWASLQVDDDALEFLEEYYSKNPIPAPVSPPPIVIPPPIPPPYTVDPVVTNMKYILNTPQDYVNMRMTPSAAGLKVGTAANGSVITQLEETINEGQYWRRILNPYDINGFISMQNGAVSFSPYLPEPPPVHVWTPAQILQLEHWRDTLVSNIANDTAHLELVQKMLTIAKGT